MTDREIYSLFLLYTTRNPFDVPVEKPTRTPVPAAQPQPKRSVPSVADSGRGSAPMVAPPAHHLPSVRSVDSGMVSVPTPPTKPPQKETSANNPFGEDEEEGEAAGGVGGSEQYPDDLNPF